MKNKSKKLNICTKLIFNLVQKFNNLSFKKVFMITLIITAVFVTISAFTFSGHAATDAGITKIEAFDKLTGHGEFLSSKYRNNYYFDITDTLGITDIFEKATNGIANILFSLTSTLLYLAITTFYYCFNVNIADLFKNIIDGMQLSLKQNIFNNLFILVFVFMAIHLVKQVFKRNTAEIVAQIFKVIFISVLATLLTTQTGAVLSASTEIAKNIGSQAILSINESGDTDNESKDTEQNFASSIAGELWYSMGHQSWLMIEGGDFNEDQQKSLLENKPNSDERKKMIKDAINRNSDFFNENIGMVRVAQTSLVLIVVGLKAGALLLLGLLQLAFQVLAIFFILLSIITLVLALVPQLGGLTLIENLAKNIFETQLALVTTTFTIATITKIDTVIMGTLQKNLNCGWLIALIFQAAVYVCVFLYRKKILKLISTTHSNIKQGHIVPRNINQRATRKVTDAYFKTGQIAGKSAAYSGKKAYQATGYAATKMGQGVRYGAGKILNFKEHLNKKQQEKENSQSPKMADFQKRENKVDSGSIKNKHKKPVLYLQPKDKEKTNSESLETKSINRPSRNIKVTENIKNREKVRLKKTSLDLAKNITVRKTNKFNKALGNK